MTDRRASPEAKGAAGTGAIGPGEDALTRLRPPVAVRRIAEILEEAGHPTWCVGGAVRDALLGIPHQDWDLATAATPRQVQRLFRRTIPVGIEFGTVGVLDDAGRMHEVTTFRRDVRTDGRHAVVEFGASLDEDLARRDLTINAIAFSPRLRTLHDPFDGRGDLARGLVRAVGDPGARMEEDRLRALRAIRFAARFGFRIETATWAAIVASAPHMARLSAERVKQELDKTFEQVRRSGAALALWRESGALATLVPSLADTSDDVLAALDCLPRAVGGRAAARRLIHHAVLLGRVPPGELTGVLRGLRFSNAESRGVSRLVALWRDVGEEVGTALMRPEPPADAAVRRWVARAGRTEVSLFLRLATAHWAARRAAGHAAPTAAAARSLYRRAVRSGYRDPVAIGDLAIGGEELRRLGVPPGPGMARILQGLLDAVLEDPSRNRVDALLARAAALAGKQTVAGPAGAADVPPDDYQHRSK
ncbi:MAG: CCA tRNA nucleotidyltransferase [Gemmatimonadaceae bacterium]